MTHDEAKKLAGELIARFPTLTTEQCKDAREEFRNFPVKAVRAAVAEHAKRPEGYNLGILLESCKTSSVVASSCSISHVPDSHADVIRRRWPQVANRTDTEVLVRYCRAELHERLKRLPEDDVARRAFVTDYMIRRCFYELSAAITEGTVRQSWAATIAWEPSDFQRALLELRGEISFGSSQRQPEGVA